MLVMRDIELQNEFCLLLWVLDLVEHRDGHFDVLHDFSPPVMWNLNHDFGDDRIRLAAGRHYRSEKSWIRRTMMPT